jgi:predicted nuclease of predicted toxin-antitoxin system
MKFIIDEDLSPHGATNPRQEFCFDAIAVRDRGLLGATDPDVLEYAFNEDRILVTANVRDFERLAAAVEIHAGIILIQEGDLLATEQIELITTVVKVLQSEIVIGKDLVNRVLYVSISGTTRFEDAP